MSGMVKASWKRSAALLDPRIPASVMVRRKPRRRESRIPAETIRAALPRRVVLIASPERPAVPRAVRQALSSLHALLQPVSYTHLRAHETVLDLVCRLL